MYGFNNSFNVSVSAALLLQSVTTKLRQQEDIEWHLTYEELLDLKINWAIKSIPNGRKISERYLKEISVKPKS